MSDIGGLFATIVAVLAVMGAAGLAYAVFTDRGNKERFASLRGDITDRNERIDFLEGENNRKDETIDKQATEISELTTKVGALEQYRDAQVVAATVLVDEIRTLHDLIQAHNATAVSGFERLVEHDAALEMKAGEILGLLGNRRTAPDESIVREVHDAG